MSLPFSFSGYTRRLPYVFGSLVIFFSQHLFTWLVLAAQGGGRAALPLDWQFAILPLQMLARSGGTPGTILILALGFMLLAAWALAALSFRRAADAGITGWVATFAIAPVIQIPVILILSLVPSRAPAQDAEITINSASLDLASAAQGLIAGMALMVFAVAMGALVFGTY